MDVPTKDVRDGSLKELLCAVDLALCGEPLNEVLYKYGRWKNTVERKGLRVNVDKTKKILFGKRSSASKVGICDEWVACSTIQFTKWQCWVHCRCSDVPFFFSL